MKDTEMKKRFYLWLSVVLVLGIFVVLTVYSKVKLGTSIVCPINEELGLECPGCGGTRMVEALIHLDVYQAFRWNPFLFLTLPPILIIYIYQSYKFIVYNYMIKYIDKIVFWYITAFVMFGILRNIEVLNCLQPTLI